MDQTPGSRSPSWPPRPLNPSYDAHVRLWRWAVGGEKVETIIISVHQICWVFILNQSFAHLQMHPIEKNFGLKTFIMMYVFEMLSKSSCFMNYWRNRFLFFSLCFSAALIMVASAMCSKCLGLAKSSCFVDYGRNLKPKQTFALVPSTHCSPNGNPF